MQDKFFITKTEDAKDINIPKYMTEGSAGLDIYANVINSEIIKPGEFKLIKTGIKISIPKNYEVQIRPRSGLALKFGVTLLNSPGTIDSDYRGEIKVILINFGKNDFVINRGDRIAQMIVSQVCNIDFIEKDSLDKTSRGENGFGHTGV